MSSNWAPLSSASCFIQILWLLTVSITGRLLQFVMPTRKVKYHDIHHKKLLQHRFISVGFFGALGSGQREGGAERSLYISSTNPDHAVWHTANTNTLQWNNIPLKYNYYMFFSLYYQSMTLHIAFSLPKFKHIVLKGEVICKYLPRVCLNTSLCVIAVWQPDWVGYSGIIIHEQDLGIFLKIRQGWNFEFL